MYICHILLICFSNDEHLGCLQHPATPRNPMMSILMDPWENFLGIYMPEFFTSHRVRACLISTIARLLSQVTVPVDTPSSSAPEYQLPLSQLHHYFPFDMGHSDIDILRQKLRVEAKYFLHTLIFLYKYPIQYLFPCLVSLC